jgi:hypothetical protein
MSRPVRIALFCLAFAIGGSAKADAEPLSARRDTWEKATAEHIRSEGDKNYQRILNAQADIRRTTASHAMNASPRPPPSGGARR